MFFFSPPLSKIGLRLVVYFPAKPQKKKGKKGCRISVVIIQQCGLKVAATPDHVTAAAPADWTVTDQQTSLGLSNGPSGSSHPSDVGV